MAERKFTPEQWAEIVSGVLANQPELAAVTVTAMQAGILEANERLRAELDDAAGYLAATHRHAARHDVLAANLGCAGCELLARIESGAEP